MCLNPKIIPTKSKVLGNGRRRFIVVPCMKCAECLQRIQNDYICRSYMEYRAAERNGGYSYFDTLTYSEDNVPMYNGMRCFSTDDIRKFRMRLTTNLIRAGYDSTKVRLFVTSEYGGRTHRPHYHIICYVGDSTLTPHALWYLIKKSWQKGYTDRYQTIKKRVINGMGAISYVAKYVSKDDDFVKQLRSKHDHYKALYFKALEEHSDLADTYYRLWQEFNEKNMPKTTIYPFHRQSLGFGVDFIDSMSDSEWDRLTKTGMIEIPDGKKIKKLVKCPMYYQRKLFYDLVDDEYCDHGNKRWKITEDGKIFKQNMLKVAFQQLTKKYNDILNNLNLYEIPNYSKEDIDYLIHDLLFGRSIEDFVCYKLCYQGKMFTTHFEARKLGRIDSDSIMPSDAFEFAKLAIQDISEVSQIKQRITEFENHQELNDMTISENTFSCFQEFDKLDRLFNILTHSFNIKKQAAYDKKQELKSKQKLLDSRY